MRLDYELVLRGGREGVVRVKSQLILPEIRVGGGVRYTIKKKLAVEISSGLTVDRRDDFHDRNLEFKSDTALYVQIGFGLRFGGVGTS